MPHQCTTCDRTFPDGSKEMLSGCPNCGGNKFQFSPAVDATSSRDSAVADEDPAGITRAGETTPSSRSSRSNASSGANADSDGITRSRSGDVDVDADADVDVNASTNAKTDRTWPGTASEQPPADDATSEFTEWPDTARRPEDRGRDRSADRRDAETTASRVNPDVGVDSPRPDVDGGDATGGTDAANGEELGDAEDAAQASARSDLVSSDELPSTGRSDQTPADEPTGAGPDVDNGRVVSEPTDDDRPSLEDLREELNEQFESIKILKPGQYELNLMELYDREEYIVSLQEDGRYVIDVPDSWRDGDDHGQ